MKVVITAPSLDESRNVSGISTIVRQIIDHGTFDYSHFMAGREDRQRMGFAWVVRQVVLPFRFYRFVRGENANVVHINTALTKLSIWRDAALSVAARLAGRPLVLSIHGGEFLVNEFRSGLLFRVATGMLKRAKLVVVYSSFERERLARRWKGLEIRILPNAIPVDEVPEFERHNAVPELVFFGRMHESKGLHEIIAACIRLEDAGFRFNFKAYGEGPLRDFFVDGMRNAIGDSFDYGGIVSGGDKWRRLAAADIFVLPSRYGEGLPMAMLEAMAAGCIVVVSDIASVNSVLDDGVNGYLVEPENSTRLFETLRRLFENQREWPRVQEAARQTVRERYEISQYIRSLEEIYEEASEIKR